MSITGDQDRALRPRNFNEYIGQDDLKTRLQISVRAALNSGRRMQHVLLTSHPGMGKTSLAYIIASQLHQPIRESARPLTQDELLTALYSFEGRRGCLFLDEIHRWPKKGAVGGQQALLPLVESGKFDTGYGREDFSNVTVIAASTDAQDIIGPLTDRFECAPYFEAFQPQELTRIVRMLSKKAGVPMSAEDAAVLGRAAGGVPRIARNLVLAARDLEECNGSRPTAAEVLEFCQVDEDALGRLHLAYLTCLLEFGGKAGLDNLANRMRIAPAAVTELERLLIGHRFVELKSTGRALTPRGRLRLKGVIAEEKWAS